MLVNMHDTYNRLHSVARQVAEIVIREVRYKWEDWIGQIILLNLRSYGVVAVVLLTTVNIFFYFVTDCLRITHILHFDTFVAKI